MPVVLIVKRTRKFVESNESQGTAINEGIDVLDKGSLKENRDLTLISSTKEMKLKVDADKMEFSAKLIY